MAFVRSFCLFLAVHACAQSLQILPSPPGKRFGSFQIMLSASGRQVAAFQWRLWISAGAAITADGIATGLVANARQKRLTCSPAAKRPGDGIRCVLAGGTAALPDGSLAVVRFTAEPGVKSATVKLTNVLGATPDGRPVRFSDVEVSLPVVALQVGAAPGDKIGFP